jgi:hypothetical protein
LRPRASAKNRWAVIGVALAIGMVCSLQWPLAWHVLECRHHQNNDGTGTEEEEETFSIVTIRESPVLQACFCCLNLKNHVSKQIYYMIPYKFSRHTCG